MEVETLVVACRYLQAHREDDTYNNNNKSSNKYEVSNHPTAGGPNDQGREHRMCRLFATLIVGLHSFTRQGDAFATRSIDRVL